jgi:peptidoglycan/xylan/chitin deacetylase (PgdA/CDA1 family)
MDGKQIAWYRLRGLGLTVLCSLVFFIGAYVTNQKGAAVSTMASTGKVPVCAVPTAQGQIALTFDLLQEKGKLPEILEALETCQVQATFFLTGMWADAYPDEVKQIVSAGHELGNYTQDYKELTGLTRQEIQQEIQQLHERIWDLTGTEMKLLRLPGQAYDAAVADTVTMSGYMMVGWSIDSEDWKEYGAKEIVRSVMNHENLADGAIIRFHCSADSTAAALEELIGELRGSGYEPVKVSQMVSWEDF